MPMTDLSMEKLYNVRDLGGFPVGRGLSVRRGLLYRAGELSDPSPADRAALEKRGIATVVDFRSKDEIQKSPDGSIATVQKRVELSIDAGNILALSRRDRDVSGEILMEDLYRSLAEDARPQYREFFAILAEKGNAPLLFHCSAGKDRTGVAAALILSALGVDRKAVYRDYLFSAGCLTEKYRVLVEAEPDLEPFLTVRRSYLEAAFAHIERHFGGVERYLSDELEADVSLLRELYTA
jgi:protein-tyrosine phosphatase